jgi:hypothetical protein
MGRNQLWKDMHWDKREATTLFSVRVPRELTKKLKLIARIEETTVAYLMRRQMITLVRRKCREHNLKIYTIPPATYGGSWKDRPLFKKNPNFEKKVFFDDDYSGGNKEEL